MTSYLTVGSLVFAATAVDALVAYLAFRRRPAAGATALTVLTLCTALWLGGYGLEVGVTTIGAKLFWAHVEWFGSMGATLAWLAFGLQYAGFDQYTRPRYVAVASVVPLLTVVFVWTNPHGLMVQHAALRTVDGLTVLAQDRGPWFYVALGYGYLTATAGMALVAYAVASAADIYRSQALALGAAFLVPVVANVLYLLGGTRTIDATPFAFTVSNVVAVVAIDRLDLLAARPVPGRLARASVFDHLDDGVLVVDALDRVVDANGSARRTLDAGDPIGRDVADFIPEWESIAADGRGDAVFGTTHRGRTYDVSVGRVTDDHDRLVGRTVVFRDVTDRRLQLQRLDVLNRVLRHNVRTEMNLAYGYADLIRERVTDPQLADFAERIERHAMELVNVADGAQSVDRALDADALDDVVAVSAAVSEAATRVRSRYPRAVVRIQAAPRGVWVGAVLESVAHALIENAVEHNPVDRPTVDVDIHASDDTVVVRVADNGPGIPEEERDVLEEGRETPLQHGSGLGLWLVSWATQTLDGTVEITDNDPRGTVVTVTVPRVEPPDDPESDADSPASASDGPDSNDADSETDTNSAGSNDADSESASDDRTGTTAGRASQGDGRAGGSGQVGTAYDSERERGE